jgi:hypothetical protein
MDYKMLGFIGITIYWRDLITNLLPPGSNGIVIVFENECNPPFSFQVNGPDVDYLGRGDLHDRKYDAMEISVSAHGPPLERPDSDALCSNTVIFTHTCHFSLGFWTSTRFGRTLNRTQACRS